MAKTKKLEDIPVMCTNSFGDPSKSDAFMRLERVVPLKGNKFYGVYNAETSEYRACVKMKEGDDPSALGLMVDTIDGGLYAYEKLEGRFSELVRQIAPTFDRMAKEHTRDESRLPIEFYKRHIEFILYLPILE